MIFSTSVPFFPLLFDNTMLSLYKDCPRKYYLAYIQGWRPKGTAPALAWGSAYHKALEVYDKELGTVGREKALVAAVRVAYSLSESGMLGDDSARTRLTLLRAIIWYSEQYADDAIKTLSVGGNPAIELPFRFLMPVGLPENVYYTGLIDKIGGYAGGHYVIDRKTTTSPLSGSYFARYEYSAQFGGYLAAGKIVFETPIHGAMIDSVQVGVNFARFGRKIFARTESHLEEWLDDTAWWIRQIYYTTRDGFFPHNQEACGKYGGCQFRSVCFASPHFRERVLSDDFHVDRWDPSGE